MTQSEFVFSRAFVLQCAWVIEKARLCGVQAGTTAPFIGRSRALVSVALEPVSFAIPSAFVAGFNSWWADPLLLVSRRHV